MTVEFRILCFLVPASTITVEFIRAFYWILALGGFSPPQTLESGGIFSQILPEDLVIVSQISLEDLVLI